METKKSAIILQEIVAAGKSYIDACLQEDTSVICINRETKRKKLISFKTLYDNNSQFWLQNESWEFFLSHDDFDRIEKKVLAQDIEWVPVMEEADSTMPGLEKSPPGEGFGNEFTNLIAMTETERAHRMEECKTRLDSLVFQKPRQEQAVTEALVETTQDVILINHISLMNAMNLSGDEARKQTQSLVDSTRDLVKTSSQLITENIFHDDLMNTLVSKSNGTTIQHMIRVYLKGLAFLSYYNKLVTSSNIINKMRISFAKKYHSFYQSLLPHIHPDDLSLERVFLGGMRAIPENSFCNWAIGFLIHDIGKAGAVEYHEGEASYNRDIVMDHVKIGYTSIMNKTNYPADAGLITGYHHEYYGDTAGYGFFRVYLEQYRKANPKVRQDFCIAYEVEPVLDYQAMAFFPAKVLEIIDVFDSLTDSSRKYKKALSTEDALVMMKEEFINKHPKLDYVLFDLFEKFVLETPSP